MSNKSVKAPLEIYQYSRYTWTLNKSEISKLSNKDYSFNQTFPETERKWKGMLSISHSINVYDVKIFLIADGTIDAKCALLLLNNKNEIVHEDRREIISCNEKKSKNFKLCGVLEICEDMFIDARNFIQIKIIIRDSVSKVSNAVCGTNTSQETKTVQKINTNEILKSDLKTMFENKEFTDFVIKLKDSSELPVHRSILAARSPVFSAMLRNDSSEKNEGYVNITDIGKDTMLILLNYIYTGNITSNLSVDGAKNLLAAADKYDILHLKRICGKYLANNLVISNAIDILLLSELHNVPDLKNCAFKLIIYNKESFLDPVKFGKVEKQFPNLMTELVMKVFVSKT